MDKVITSLITRFERKYPDMSSWDPEKKKELISILIEAYKIGNEYGRY